MIFLKVLKNFKLYILICVQITCGTPLLFADTNDIKIQHQEQDNCLAPCQFGFSKLNTTVGSIEMYYTLRGRQNSQPIILLHGGGLTSNMNTPLAKLLYDKKFQVWTVDTRGHGLTRNPTNSFDYQVLITDLNEFIKINNIQKPILLGYSDGGITALGHAILYPNVAKAIIAIAAAPIKRELNHYYKGLEIFYGKKASGDSQNWLKSLLLSEKMKTHYSERHLDGLELLKKAWPIWNEPGGYTEKEFQSINMPVQLIIGSEDQFYTPADILRIHRAIKKSALTLVHDDHLFFKNNSEYYQQLILDSISHIDQL